MTFFLRMLRGAAVLAITSVPLSAGDIETPRAPAVVETPYRVSATGFVTDSSHPRRPGDFARVDVVVHFSISPVDGETTVELEVPAHPKSARERWLVRRGRIFQVDAEGHEVPAAPLGDISAAAIAALLPTTIGDALKRRGENAELQGTNQLFAWNDALWRISMEGETGRIRGLSRRTYHQVFGDGEERLKFEWGEEPSATPTLVVVTSRGRETARLMFGKSHETAYARVPRGDPRRDIEPVLTHADIAFSSLGAGLYAVDLPTLDMRVLVVEFATYLVVLEGAYNSRNTDLIAASLRQRFAKPVRYFAFSHLHGQYVGGIRSWVAEGATVLTPPTTLPLLRQIAQSSHTFNPDSLSRSSALLRVESIEDRLRLADESMALEIFNVDSDHTDEYLIFYLPTLKTLIVGDLLFYRPGKILSGRSLKLCDTVRQLGIEVDRYVASWPLSGDDGTKNVVTAAEMRAGCGVP